MHVRILIVESNPYVALDLQRTLHCMGYSAPIVAPTGKEAIQLSGTTRFSLMLTELDLEGSVTGKEAAQIVQERFRTPVIFMTSDAERSLVETAVASDPFACLLKPIRKCILRMAVKRVLQLHKAETGVDVAYITGTDFKRVECGNSMPLIVSSMSEASSSFGQVVQWVPRSLEAMGYALEGYWEQRWNCGSKDYLEPHFQLRTPSGSTCRNVGSKRDRSEDGESSGGAIDCVGVNEVCRSVDGSTYKVPRLRIRLVTKESRFHGPQEIA